MDQLWVALLVRSDERTSFLAWKGARLEAGRDRPRTHYHTMAKTITETVTPGKIYSSFEKNPESVSLDFVSTGQATPVPALPKSVTTLTMGSYIGRLSDIPEQIEVLELFSSIMIETLEGLHSGLKVLRLFSCESLHDLSGLPETVEELVLYDCDYVNLRTLPRMVRRLELDTSIVDSETILPPGTAPTELALNYPSEGSSFDLSSLTETRALEIVTSDLPEDDTFELVKAPPHLAKLTIVNPKLGTKIPWIPSLVELSLSPKTPDQKSKVMTNGVFVADLEGYRKAWGQN